MFASGSVIDIVLNGFALFFIKDLDDLMMSLGDYGSLKWDYLGGYWDEKYQGLFQGDHPKEEQMPFEMVDCDYYWVIRLVNGVVFGTNIILILAPLYLFVCF